MAICFSSYSLGVTLGQARPAIDPSVEAQILSATVQIRMFTPALEQQDIAPEDMRYEVAAGLGTSATLAGEPVIITHNHWGEDLETAQFVRFYDAWGKEQLRLSGADFRKLVRYQNTGTMLLSTPEPLRAARGAGLAVAGDSDTVPMSSRVVCVHKAPDGSGQVALLVARVESVEEFQGLPAFEVHSLDGQTFVKGDSGGGVWYNGQLVSNVWARFSNQNGRTGYAALLPEQ